jgi:hypothetical protein
MSVPEHKHQPDMNMFVQAMTVMVYVGLFDMGLPELRAHVGLPQIQGVPTEADNEELLDQFGIEALQAVTRVENRLSVTMAATSGTFRDDRELMRLCIREGERERAALLKVTALIGLDPVTGHPIADGRIL